MSSRLDISVLLENAAYIGIKRKLDYENEIYKIGFFRSQAGSEIDIVLKTKNKEDLFEVKARHKAKKDSKVKYITGDNIYQYL